jgi:hypothetical protein
MEPLVDPLIFKIWNGQIYNYASARKSSLLLAKSNLPTTNNTQIIYATFFLNPQEVNNIDELTQKHNKALKFVLINQPTFYIYNDG